MMPGGGGMGPGPVLATMRPGTMGMSEVNMSGMGGAPGAPPGTGMRVPTGHGQRGMMGSRGGTRQGTAVQQPMGVGALTEVKVAERPMTMHGLSGMKTGSVGPKRQIYDKTYYIGELRKRCQELQQEITAMNKEISDVQNDNQLCMNLEKRYDTLVKTVRSLEGDLADHNLATDKQRTDTRPEEVHHMYMIMKSQNEQQRSDVDQIFMEKRSHEEQILQVDQEIAAIARAAEDRLNELHPEQRREYEMLREENNRICAELSESREDLDQLIGQLNIAEGRLRSDLLRTRHEQLANVHKELAQRLQGLEADMRQCSMSIPDQRELLLSKVKTDNAEIVATEKRNSDLKLEKEKLRTQIKEVVADAQERKDEGGDQQKYEILCAKDTEMTQFIDGFDASKAEEEARLKDKEESVVRLLENISRAINLRPDMSPESHLRDMEDELDFKSKQLQNSETTQNRLEAELAKREGELDKIESLDAKISQELQQVETKMQQYEHEIETVYDLVGDMRANGEQQAKELAEKKGVLEGRVAVLKQQVGFLRIRYESKQQQLSEIDCDEKLSAQEKKIRQFGQTLHALQSFVQQKSSESNFQAEKENCMTMSTQINQLLQGFRMSTGGA
mmetsp:Transcript_44047/g.121917  ORF Transcript_44047/g.121917 Transcript_44047/m.121917 type:complete len:618 (-) Transcript_44047:72-1925(-)|eukprot:CAMPEP_0117511106 /NCGR_PEP_ID=MMETSP0784-20121206/28335_1 /TAXON_ID=39447 /ORGANISM="" /LENGTH=617 /DNA_ID=CAMNT_0005306765 /DNA_START=17 /DNA_END=1870 /DNA_ORIENTATION=+